MVVSEGKRDGLSGIPGTGTGTGIRQMIGDPTDMPIIKAK